MSGNSPERAKDAKLLKTDRDAKSMPAPTPSLPKEEQRKKLEAASDNLQTLRRELEEEKAKSRQYLDRLKYLQADFENSVKRLRREVEEARRYGNEQLILNLIDVAENLERAIEAGQNVGEKSEFITGVKMISKQLNSILEQEGLERIPTEGERFNPALHEALVQTESTEKDEGTILKELKRGYMLKDRILRPSKVEVAKRPSSSKDSTIKST